MTAKRKTIYDILEAEYIEPNAEVAAMCEKIQARHKDRVCGLLFYGSSLRTINDREKMLDFYVLVDSYRKTHKNPIRALLNALIPPAVYYLENTNEDGTLSTCKYSIISLGAFERKTTGRAFLSVIWGRFSQPCILLYPRTKLIAKRIQTARVNAVRHLVSQTAPLCPPSISAIEFFARAFRESYRTELRPEKSKDRSLEIVTRYQDRYEAILNILYGPPNSDGKFYIPKAGKLQKTFCQLRWALRRFIGKPAAGLRVLNSAFTFDGGIDYVLHKLKSHSGVTIDITPSQRKHPILWSPVLAWKLYKKGAFR